MAIPAAPNAPYLQVYLGSTSPPYGLKIRNPRSETLNKPEIRTQNVQNYSGCGALSLLVFPLF